MAHPRHDFAGRRSGRACVVAEVVEADRLVETEDGSRRRCVRRRPVTIQ